MRQPPASALGPVGQTGGSGVGFAAVQSGRQEERDAEQGGQPICPPDHSPHAPLETNPLHPWPAVPGSSLTSS
jgi:hypothetical protein